MTTLDRVKTVLKEDLTLSELPNDSDHMQNDLGADSPRPGDTVLDCFGGSGTTCAVAEELGRNWFYIDASEAYAELARARIGGVDRLQSTKAVAS